MEIEEKNKLIKKYLNDKGYSKDLQLETEFEDIINFIEEQGFEIKSIK